MNKVFLKNYLLTDDLSTFDPYDIWKTSIGKNIKQLYYRNKYLGILPAGVLNIFDLYINNKHWGYKKQEFPIVRAQAALALMNLYRKDSKKIYLEYAKKHIDWLLLNSSQGYSGYCWGLNFTWVYSQDETYDANTPFSTHSPYPLEALVEYFKLTQDMELLEQIKSIFLFLENDIQIMQENQSMLILSYGVKKDRIVTNANAYLMYMYALLLSFLPDKKEYIENKIYKIYNFLLSTQRDNGSWLYSPYQSNSFIDCFHSVFVLKNIYKTNKILKLHNSKTIIDKGYRFILENFIDEKYFLFKRFSLSNKPSLVKFDLYDNSEILNLANLLEDETTVKKLDEAIKKSFITKNIIYSIIDIFGYKKNANHLRWAAMPYIYALSSLKDNKCVV